MKNSKILTALLSLVLALGIWAYVITVEKPGGTEIYHNVPVVFRGESALAEKQLMLMNDENPTIAVELAGNRSYLNKLKSSDILVEADLSTIYSAGEQTLLYSISYPSSIPQNSLQILNGDPPRLTVEIANRASKDIPVQVRYTGSLPEEYISDKDNPVFDYAQINVKGPDMVIDKIHHARIDVDLSGRTESINESYRYTLCDANDEPVDGAWVTTNTSEVHLEVKILRKMEIPLVVKVNAGGGATEATCTWNVEPKSIWVAGSDAALKNLRNLEIGTLNLGEIPNDTKLNFEFDLPEGITNLSGVTRAAVNVSFPTLKTRQMTVTNITPVNVPEGMEAEILTTQLKISIRGVKDVINSLSLSDIKVTVDLAEEEAGTFTAKAKVALGGNYAGCGEVGTYSVSVILRPVSDE